jgi:very-short-patch-repair endonuclease
LLLTKKVLIKKIGIIAKMIIKNLKDWLEMYYFITIVGLLLIAALVLRRLHQNQRQDSPLKRRGILTISEQITLMRLQAVLPRHTILAHVSFDALLTTKYAHTRRKYQGLVADFVVLDQQHQVLVVIEIVDESYVNRLHQKHYQDSLLELAGYRVLRYSSIPTEQELRDDLVSDPLEPNTTISTVSTGMVQAEHIMKYNMFAAKS